MKKRGTTHKFIISFLSFYIIISLSVNVINEDIFHAFVTGSVLGYSSANAIDDNKGKENSVLGIVADSNPMFAYVDEYQTDKPDNSDPMLTVIENTEKESSKSEKETTAKKEEKKNTNKEEETTEKTQNVANVFSIPKITGNTYSVKKLSDFDFLLNNFYTVASSTEVYKSDLDPNVLLNKDMTMKQDNSKPQILIYHTHSQETFIDSKMGKQDMSIVGVGTYLTEILTEQYNYNVIHLTDSFDIVNGVLDRHKAYDQSLAKVKQVLEEYPSIELMIDLHRDGVDESMHLVTEVNGKPTAQIMFFNGLSRLASVGEIDYLYNPNREDNLALSLQMKMKAEAYYPGLTRKNYLHAYEYNLSLLPKAMLIEVGAQTNTFQEELNAMEPLAVLLHMTLSGEGEKE
ncbi:MAG: stage II sporulation protein P [Lachnospiraceae bacterium]|nr:stage II sporulation protein P [Lachnospiraceae bacterium]MBQ4068248.1 stage II sporulation protein P [Lachnospiraceae bacterium]